MVFITGATGIVGTHFLLHFLQNDIPVRALKRKDSSLAAVMQLLRYHNMESAADRIQWVEGDVNDPVGLILATEGCERVYHCAAMVSFDRSDEELLDLINVKGTENIVNACLTNGINELVFISSTAAIGDREINGSLTEESEWTTNKGRSAYSMSKREAELSVWRAVQEGMKCIIVNPGVIIGPGQWGKSSTSLIESCKNGMRFYPTGSNGFVDARDIIDAVDHLLNKNLWNQRYLLIGENLSFQSLFTEICQQMGTSAPKLKISKNLIRPLWNLIEFLEWIRLNPFPLTSENLSSAYKNVNYETAKMKATGFEFRGIQEAVKYTIEVRGNAR